jgi:UDP:flavonoid glycosyltransferase YjiC (YdhE family)
MKRIVLTTFGSYGDLHPYIALAHGLQARGHEATIVTSALYRDKVSEQGIGFQPMRPNIAELGDQAEIVRRVYDRRRGAEYLTRELIMPYLPQTFDDLLAAARHADVLVSHPITYAAPLVARKLELPWLSTVLQPMVFMSAYDPPILPPAPWLKGLHSVSPALYRLAFGVLKRTVRSWSGPVRQLARAQGLPETDGDPLFEGQFSPHGTLALFSPVLADPQPDWPPRTRITGFPFHDADPVDPAAMRALEIFLDAGEAPIVFTLGSSAVFAAGDFYRQAVEIAQRLERRAVLLTGQLAGDQGIGQLPPGMFATQYAPYSMLFPRAAAVVHQGGVGTLAQALRAGRPMLVVSFSHDQPDNGERAERLGCARHLPRVKFTVARAADALRELLGDPCYARAGAAIAQRMAREDGVATACDCIAALA